MTEPLMLRSTNRRLEVQLEEASEPFVVRYPRKSRDTGRRITFPGFGTSRVTEQTPEPNRRAVSFNSRKLPWSMQVELTADSLKRQVRARGARRSDPGCCRRAAGSPTGAQDGDHVATLERFDERGLKELVEAAEAVEAARS